MEKCLPDIQSLTPITTPATHDLPRFGVVVLATDLTFERDINRLISDHEASVHVSRIAFENPTTPESLSAMGPGLAAAADLLVPGVDLAAIVFACTAASVTISNEVVTSAIGKVRPGVPVVTPSMAALSALRALKARKIALLTPYLVETTRPMVRYFETQGMSIERVSCFELADDRQMARLDHKTLVSAAVSLDTSDVDALFLSCTALPALDVIEEIEQRLGKPVVSSNQATGWALRGLGGLAAPEYSAGRLLSVPWSSDTTIT